MAAGTWPPRTGALFENAATGGGGGGVTHGNQPKGSPPLGPVCRFAPFLPTKRNTGTDMRDDGDLGNRAVRSAAGPPPSNPVCHPLLARVFGAACGSWWLPLAQLWTASGDELFRIYCNPTMSSYDGSGVQCESTVMQNRVICLLEGGHARVNLHL